MPARDSPFPGMDPYLERHWSAVQAHLVPAAMLALNDVLPDDLVARVEERLAVGTDELPDVVRRVVPDVRVFEPGSDPIGADGTAVLTAPFKLVVDLDPAAELFVNVVQPDGERLVCVIEFVSPANKTVGGVEQMAERRSALVRAGTHVVEVDLVRRGNWRRLLAPHVCPAEAVADYRYTVRLANRPAAAYLYPAPLRRPLPPVPIPLRPEDPVVELDLQQLMAAVYRGGRYGRTLSYADGPSPPLSTDDAAWADGLLRAAGCRI